MAPAGTSDDILDMLNEEIRAIQQDEAVRAEWAQQGVTPMIMTRDEFDAHLRADIEKWAGDPDLRRDRPVARTYRPRCGRTAPGPTRLPGAVAAFVSGLSR